MIEVPLPSSLSATALARLRDAPDGFAADLARPMPRQPSPAARFGTRFHAWVESRFGQQDLFDPDDLPGRGDAGIDDDADLQELIATFEAGPFADRVPYAVEAPFALVLRGQVVRGPDRRGVRRAGPDGDGWLVVDWKTNRTPEPTRGSSRSTGWRGPSCRACRWSGCARSSTSCAPARSSSRPTCPAARGARGALRLASAVTTRAGLSPAEGGGEGDLDHLAEGLLALGRRRLLAGDDVVGDGADRQRLAAVLGGQRVERAGLHLDGEDAVARPSARRGRAARCRRSRWRRAGPRGLGARGRSAASTAPRSSPKSATGA